MHVRRVKGKQCVRIANPIEVNLPERGIVTITGPNESGKSSFLEAVAVALWGETLRGTNPWHGGQGAVEIETDQVVALRQGPAGKGAKLRWNRHGAEAVKWATPTKAQEALEEIIGDFQTWRRTSVFSSSDALLFSQATDATQKRLIERLIGTAAFDPALEECRQKGRDAGKALSDAESKILLARERLTGAERRLADAADLAEPPPPPPRAPEPEPAEEPEEPVPDASDVMRQIASLSEKLSAGQVLLQEIEKRSRGALKQSADAAADYNQARRRWELLGGGKCPTCAQAIPPEMSDSLKASVDGATKAAADAREEADRVKADAEAEAAEVREEQQGLERRRSELRATVSGIDRAKEQRAARERAREQRAAAAARRLEEEEKQRAEAERRRQAEAKRRQDIRASAQASIDAAKKEIDALSADRARHSHEVGVLSAVESVLGLEGVRAQILGGALVGIERAANAYLARVARPDLSLELRPTKELKGGGTSDKISLKINGLGESDYRAGSSGMRRRIDVSLLLALAEIAAGAAGGRPGTLFFDEVFDTLDEAGIEAIVSVLQDLAEERAVVIITHSRELAERLPGKHLRALDGAITGD